MPELNKKPQGFTIVELLIVIVVIAILAAISVVAYTGIQNRANDTAIQADVTNLAKKIRLYEAEQGELPKGGTATGQVNQFPGIEFSPSKTAYDTSGNNLFYCEGSKSGSASFVILARSKSKEVFIFSPEDGLVKAPDNTMNIMTSCAVGWDGNVWSRSFGFYNPPPPPGYPASSGTWFGWANG